MPSHSICISTEPNALAVMPPPPSLVSKGRFRQTMIKPKCFGRRPPLGLEPARRRVQHHARDGQEDRHPHEARKRPAEFAGKSGVLIARLRRQVVLIHVRQPSLLVPPPPKGQYRAQDFALDSFEEFA